jgi:CheY-like chemotaxis protein
MTHSQKLVLMVQETRIQGLIWQAVLRSQNLAVIWGSSDTNLANSLDQIKTAGLVLPDLLLIDMRIPKFNAYAFCRWCREHHPEIKILLTNVTQRQIAPSERKWAMNQGAADVLTGFQRDNLVNSVAIAVQRTLEILDEHPLDNNALISILLLIKRELGGRTGNPVAHAATQEPMRSPDLDRFAEVPPPPISMTERKRRAAQLSQEAERVVFSFPDAHNQLA